MEIWKRLHRFPNYEGSTEGRIKNIRTQRILKPYKDQEGRLKVTLRNNNKQRTVKVGNVIAETFLGEHPGMDIYYKDRDHSNVNADNLGWRTRQDTVRDGYERRSRNSQPAVHIRVIETGKIYNSILDCAKDLDCDKSSISKYLTGKLQHVKGYHFEAI